MVECAIFFGCPARGSAAAEFPLLLPPEDAAQPPDVPGEHDQGQNQGQQPGLPAVAEKGRGDKQGGDHHRPQGQPAGEQGDGQSGQTGGRPP